MMYLTALLVLVPGGLVFVLFYRGKRWIELVATVVVYHWHFRRLELQWSVQRRIEAVDALAAVLDPRDSQLWRSPWLTPVRAGIERYAKSLTSGKPSQVASVSPGARWPLWVTGIVGRGFARELAQPAVVPTP